MTKKLIVLALALAMLLPIIVFATETTMPETQTTPEATTPYGWGRRWNQAPAQPANPAAPYGFVDENKDGICDTCGNEPGKNTQAPGFVDADGDGVCDNLGTARQHQGRVMMQGRGRMPHGRMGQGLFMNQNPGSSPYGMPFGPGRRGR